MKWFWFEFSIVGIIMFALALTAICGFIYLEGWLFMSLWNWIMPLIWTSAPVMNIGPAIAIMLIIGFVSGLFYKYK